MSGTLLVGTDGSDGGGRALAYAAEQAKKTGAELVIAYVIEWSPYTFSTPSENEVRHKRREEEIERAQADVIDPLVEKYSEQGVDVRGVVRHGHAAEVLDALGNELQVQGIYVGRRGSSRLAALLFGSVTASLVQIADCPVTVVP